MTIQVDKFKGLLMHKHKAVDVQEAVANPGTSTDNAIARWDGTDGKKIQDSIPTISDAGEVNIWVGANKVGLTSKSEYVGIEGEGVGSTSFGVTGKSDNIPAQFANMLKTVTGIHVAEVLRGDSANLEGPVQTGYALRKLFRLPVNDFIDPAESEVDAGAIDCIWDDVTTTHECSGYIFSLQHNGVLLPSMKLLGNGTLYLRNSTNTAWIQIGLPTSVDGSITINGLDLSVKRPELELYASTEAELLTAWTLANAHAGSVRIYITGSVTFTANRQFIRAYSSPSIKFEAITPIYFIAGSYVIDFGNIVFTNITFRTTGTYYFRVVGGVGIFNNCGWIDDVRDASLGDTPKKNIVIIDPVTANTGKIVLKGITHFTQNSTYNNGSLIQPFWIENQASFGSAIYIENLEMSAVSEAARFARVLLTSTVANCPYKVSGDESWFFAPAQELPGVGNIAATAQILRNTIVDNLSASRLDLDNMAAYLLGITPAGKMVKLSNVRYKSEIVAAPTSGTLTLKLATETYIGSLTNANVFTVALPAPISGFIAESVLLFKIGSSLPTITQPAGIVWRGIVPTLLINTSWTICYEQVNSTGSTYEIWATAVKNS